MKIEELASQIKIVEQNGAYYKILRAIDSVPCFAITNKFFIGPEDYLDTQIINTKRALKLATIFVSSQIQDPIMLDFGVRKPIYFEATENPTITKFLALAKHLQTDKFVVQSNEELNIHINTSENKVLDYSEYDLKEYAKMKVFITKEDKQQDCESLKEEIEEYRKRIDETPRKLATCVMAAASNEDENAIKVGEIIGQSQICFLNGGSGRTIPNHPEKVNAMKSSRDGALESGSPLVGIITIPHLKEKEGVDDRGQFVFMTQDILERMEAMYSLSDFITVLKGGMGTVQEVLRMMYYNLIAKEDGRRVKPIWIINIDGFWNDLINWLDNLKILSEVKIVNSLDEYKEELGKL